ncbi:hypothetical protein [Paenibacillus ginsengihumi]|uniref:hypothetical protein n=1 Tax=Paenibacillus ginsengihumi TaxID=431596 RepID=UPI000370ED6D
MFTHIIPKFEKGRVLKTRMLENLRDFPREFTDVMFREYVDGIVTGAEIEVAADRLIISPGIVKHQGRLYLLHEPVTMPYETTGREKSVKIRFHEGKQEHDWISHGSEIVMDELVEPGPAELELCRFKLKEGARLRQDYQSFRDLATEFNTVNLLHVKYALPGKSTLSPVILRYFADELLRRGSQEPYDLMFGMMCLNEGVLNRDVILHYITSRLGIGFRDYTNVELHKHLARILDTIRGGGRMGGGASGSLRVIVD